MHRAALLLLLPVLLTAQGSIIGRGGVGSPGRISPNGAPQTNPPPPTRPEDLCGVEGQVVNAVTGEPVSRAAILLMRADPVPGESGPPTSYSIQSRADGQFAMKDVEPGKYRLTVNRNGYVTFNYGARGPMRMGATLSLIRQQQVKDMVLKLTPQAVITGRIVDGEGEPVANARVMLQGYHYVNGRKQLTSTGGRGGSTNDLGEYRLFGVAPGKYYLSVSPVPLTPMFAIDRSGSAGAEEDYVATYYPGAIDPAAAAQLEVPAGAQLRGIDLALSKARTVHVKGHVTHGLPGRQNISVFLTPRNSGIMLGPMRNNPPDAAGNFDIGNVSPGPYNLNAAINEGAGPRQARIPVDVGATSVEGLNIVIGPGIKVKGHLRADGNEATLDFSGVRINLVAHDPGAAMFGGSSRLNADGSFAIENAAPERYDLSVTGLPVGCYVKSIASDQVDVLASGLDITAGAAPADLEVVISPKAAALSGAVQNPDTGNPMPGVMVVLVPQEKRRQEQPGYFKTVTSDQNGAFSMTGLAPGDYKAYAWEDVEMGAYMDPEFMKPVEGKGEAVTLQEGEQKALTLKVIPAETAPGAAK